MENFEQLRQKSEFEDEILNLIDNADKYTRSDLQGIVGALVRRIMEEGGESPRALPRIKLGNTTYFVDARLRQLRNVNNPHDFIDYGDDYAGVIHALEKKAAHGA